MAETYEAIAQVDCQRIQADDLKKEGPFTETPLIDHKVKQAEKQKCHPAGHENERTSPEVLIDREMQTPQKADGDRTYTQ